MGLNEDLMKKGLRRIALRGSLAPPRCLNEDLMKKGLRHSIVSVMSVLRLNEDLMKKGLRQVGNPLYDVS